MPLQVRHAERAGPEALGEPVGKRLLAGKEAQEQSARLVTVSVLECDLSVPCYPLIGSARAR